jgi:hypothetical protein
VGLSQLRSARLHDQLVIEQSSKSITEGCDQRMIEQLSAPVRFHHAAQDIRPRLMNRALGDRGADLSECRLTRRCARFVWYAEGPPAFF